MESDRLERRPSNRYLRALVAGSIVAVALGLTACTTQTPTAVETTATPSVTSTTTTPSIALVPDGTAEENQPFFDQVNARTAANPDVGGRDFVDALVAAGFDKGAMEVTNDTTTLGDRAESIQFSVRWGDSCLIGQFGSAVDGYHSTVQPVLGDDLCLIGDTRPIDW